MELCGRCGSHTDPWHSQPVPPRFSTKNSVSPKSGERGFVFQGSGKTQRDRYGIKSGDKIKVSREIKRDGQIILSSAFISRLQPLTSALGISAALRLNPSVFMGALLKDLIEMFSRKRLFRRRMKKELVLGCLFRWWQIQQNFIDLFI